jgi:hypothetical protein
VLLGSLLAVLWAGLVLYSQTLAWHGDEGFHLLAAQLVAAGKRPYLDFFYQHVPLHIMVTAGWFRLFGDTWRSAHALAALFTGATLLLIAQFVYARTWNPVWKVAAACAAAILVGVHAEVIRTATVALGLGQCLFLSSAAFHASLQTVRRNSDRWTYVAGVCAGGAAASSLLVVAVPAILLLWIVRQVPCGTRARRGVWFLAGLVLPFLPLAWLAVQGPRQTWFDVVAYHLFYRQTAAGSRLEQFWNDLKTAYSVWLETPQGLILLLLGGVGLLVAAGLDPREHPEREEWLLCACLSGGVGLLLFCTAPLFSHYFILVVPFLGALGALGLASIGASLGSGRRPTWLLCGVAGVFALGLVTPTYRVLEGDLPPWPVYAELAREVNRVTPPAEMVWASDELVYFIARRIPPAGLENVYAQSLPVFPDLADTLRAFPLAQLEASLKTGRFATAVTESDHITIARLGLACLYRDRIRVAGYEIFWNRAAPGGRARTC